MTKALTKLLDSSKRLSSEEETILFTRYNKLKTKKAKNKVKNIIIQANIGLVLKVASKFKSLDVEEAFSEGIIILHNCIEKFDITRKFKFSTYAYRALIMRYIKMHHTHNSYVSKYKNVEVDVSYEVNFDEHVDLPQLKAKLKVMLEELPTREQNIIVERYFNEYTLDKLGQKHNISKERVRQIIKCSLRTMRGKIGKI